MTGPHDTNRRLDLAVAPEDLINAAKAITNQLTALAALARSTPTPSSAAVGQPDAARALHTLAERYRSTFTALEADQHAAAVNLQASGQDYQGIEARILRDLIARTGSVGPRVLGGVR